MLTLDAPRFVKKWPYTCKVIVSLTFPSPYPINANPNLRGRCKLILTRIAQSSQTLAYILKRHRRTLCTRDFFHKMKIIVFATGLKTYIKTYVF